MQAEYDEAMALQDRLLGQCEALAEAIAIPASRRDSAAILETWAEINRLRRRMNSAHRRLRTHVRKIKAEAERADPAAMRELDSAVKLLGKRLRMWDSMETLVERHVAPEHTDLVPALAETEADALLVHLHRGFHLLANPRDQSQTASDAGCFADIPMRVRNFDLLLCAAYRVLMVLGRSRNARFIDVGCGGATTVFMAERYFTHCDGLEYDADYASAGQRTLSVISNRGGTVYQGDGRTFDYYCSYDVIYFYRPLRNEKMLEEMENHIIKTARPGTILLAPYDFTLSARPGFNCAMLEEPVFITGMTQAEADELRNEACRTGHGILRRSSNFQFDTGFWTPILDAASFNGSRLP